MGDGQWIAYSLVRAGVAAAGVLAILAIVLCHFLAPGIYYDHLSKPPPLRERLPEIAAWLVVGSLLLLPHRLTMRGWLFWPRLAVSVAVGLLLVGAGVAAIAAGLRGGRDPAIYPAGVGFMLAGVSVPGCLWWRRRLTRHCSGRPAAAAELQR
ncbi:MAG: hypothetical protein U0800_22725 [Isosphaeraceae bacterium]